MTIPTPTVIFESLMTNLPSSSKFILVSAETGFCNSSSTIADSPDLINFGASSMTSPVLLSSLEISRLNLAVVRYTFIYNIGVYPSRI